VFFHHQWYNEEVCFFIAIHAVSFQYIIMRIANPVTQLGWTANPAQRE
jgi:hypothetical protein